jgi:endonuclease YncB( thermonuclease family)
MKYFLIAFMATMLGPIAVHSQQKPVKILSVTNGQQLLVEMDEYGRAVRLACLQAPRFRQGPWAEFAQSVLESHVKRGDQALFELRSRDVYGRLVGRVFVNGKDLGAQLVQQGSVMAWDGLVGRCDDLNYSELEIMAKDAGLGLWSASPALERPWDVMEAAGGGEP